MAVSLRILINLSIPPGTMSDRESTNRLLLAHWAVLDKGLQNLDCVKRISGYHLDIATVVLVAQCVSDGRQMPLTNEILTPS